ncbi:MAG: glycosyltransferase [Deltaproteobacteria bacterium]|nr:glycosyltransferase [Deltaproteobacteria bacterium]
MGRILFGVMGDAGGHVSEALTIAGEMPEHEFLFLGGGKVHELKKEGYNVEDLPMLSTSYKNNKVDFFLTATNALRALFSGREIRQRVSDIIKNFDPDLILTNYEYFTPLTARELGRPCVSVDHQHILTHCKFVPPRQQYLSRFLTRSSVRYLYSNCMVFLIVSFFVLPPIDPETVLVLPPLLRKTALKTKATDGDHVLVYQTSPTFHKLFPILKTVDAKFLIYGFGTRPSEKNLVFKPNSSEGFIEDLASSRYAITNGGHNVICEAIYFGKPVLSFPIANAYEQYLNAYYVSHLGYGDYSAVDSPSKSLFDNFETRVDEFKLNIGREPFAGNNHLIKLLNHFVATGEYRILL